MTGIVSIIVATGIITVLSMMAMGYQAGLTGGLRFFPMVMLVMAFAMLIALIADLDRPQGGLLKVSKTALSIVQSIMDYDTQFNSTIIKGKE